MHAYREFAEEWMAMPVLTGPKSDGQKFPGAVYTLCIEAMMQDGKALQAGTSHFLGQNFAKAFDVTFQNEKGQREHAWATSWGVSTRLIGGLIMTHSDDNGLVVPPRLAPIHVVICPLGKNDAERGAEHRGGGEAGSARSRHCRATISSAISRSPSRSTATSSTCRASASPSGNCAGVPVRVEIGPKDLEKQACVVARRDIPGKEGKTIGVPLAALRRTSTSCSARSRRTCSTGPETFRDANPRGADSYDQFKQMIEQPGFIWAHWDGTPETETKISEETKATIRCIPFDRPEEGGKCMVTGKPRRDGWCLPGRIE